ncbi:helix-turn-helix domain-containing protein [Brucella gallinifaecis]|uniref:Helix-turn-helix domain-containing protein n=1 Tax=Brucella gallinifaecis TaxID=215590 RepID=A0A502BPJ3_9HYPH|nr:AraC family transcriptional regulator [Brucella gallinifaecis]TPF76104.1 helix-turn-helix domain-containing protein [Brucella gallinifaecis]
MKKEFFFSTNMVDAKRKDDLWRETIKPIYEVSENTDEKIKGFHGSVRWRAIGSLLIGNSTFNSQRYVRTKRTIAQSGLDHYIIQIVTAGTMYSTFNDVEVYAQPGDIYITDLSQTTAGEVSAGSRININISKNELEKIYAWKNLHGVILKQHLPSTKILSNYIQGIINIEAEFSAVEAIGIKEALLSLLSSSLNGVDKGLSGDWVPILNIRHRIIAFIENNLANPLLCPQFIIEHFHISRSNLYRLFEKHGGISKFIRDKRLKLAYKIIMFSPDRVPSIKEISYRCGFNDPSQLIKSFKKMYGVNPKGVKENKYLLNSSEDSILLLQKHLSLVSEDITRSRIEDNQTAITK